MLICSTNAVVRYYSHQIFTTSKNVSYRIFGLNPYFILCTSILYHGGSENVRDELQAEVTMDGHTQKLIFSDN